MLIVQHDEYILKNIENTRGGCVGDMSIVSCLLTVAIVSLQVIAYSQGKRRSLMRFSTK